MHLLNRASGEPRALSRAAHYVRCAQALWTLLAFELDAFPFIQGLVAVLLNSGEMHKYVFSRGTLNKTIALGPVKPLHYPVLFHLYSPFNAVHTMPAKMPENTKSHRDALKINPSGSLKNPRNTS